VGEWRGCTLGRPTVFYNKLNVMSYAMARLKGDYGYDSNDLRPIWRYERTETELRAMLAEGGRYHDLVIEGGAWWTHTQWAIERYEATRAGDSARLEKLDADIAEWHKHILSHAVGDTVLRSNRNQQ
jgi:hypothetical protein